MRSKLNKTINSKEDIESIFSTVPMEGFGSTSSNRIKSFKLRYSIHFLDVHPFDEITNGFFGNSNCFAEFLPKMIFCGCLIVNIILLTNRFFIT